MQTPSLSHALSVGLCCAVLTIFGSWLCCCPGHRRPCVPGAVGGDWAWPAQSALCRALQWAEALAVFQQAADWIGLESRKSLWGQFWSAHQRFFKYLCIAAKVRRLVELAREELARDKVSRGKGLAGLRQAWGPVPPLSQAGLGVAGQGTETGEEARTQPRRWRGQGLPGAWLMHPSPPPSLQCVVIGLQSTGEARTREVLDENDGHLDCFVSAAE